jgi:predicted CoA-substrate-specific enzyme activase
MFAGVDIGSLTCKAVIFDGAKVRAAEVVAAGSFPRRSGEAALKRACCAAGTGEEALRKAVCTGYGRNLLAGCKAVTEITCCARGAAFLFPGVELIIDIGGQDSKVIQVDSHGKPTGFLTNDKCAAGTGRFLETMARAMDLQVDKMALLGHDAEPVEISNTCGVFAESEVVGLLASETPVERIVAGINKSIVDRALSLVYRLGVRNNVFFCGGVAKNHGIRRAFEAALQKPLIVPDDPQIVAATGAAIIAAGIE